MRTWAEVSIENLRHNYDALRARTDGSRFLGVVKANAYGHGSVRISQELAALGADYLGVASLDEAERIAEGVSNHPPILIMGYTPCEEADELISGGFTQTVMDIDSARIYSERAISMGKSLKIHVKLDTGMGRIGFHPQAGMPDEIFEILSLPGLEPEGIFTHFAVADELGGEEFTYGQMEKFKDAVAQIECASGVRFEIKHCANSGGVVNYGEAFFDMVRPGIALYGGCAGSTGGLDLRPVMSLKTRVAHIKNIRAGDSVSYGRTYIAPEKRKIAVLPVGYADGLHRAMSGKIDVLINGQRATQIGRICMDMCMVDITQIDSCSTGDVVTIFGVEGDSVITLEEQAEKAGTITYELLCAVSPRVPRVYI